MINVYSNKYLDINSILLYYLRYVNRRYKLFKKK